MSQTVFISIYVQLWPSIFQECSEIWQLKHARSAIGLWDFLVATRTSKFSYYVFHSPLTYRLCFGLPTVIFHHLTLSHRDIHNSLLAFLTLSSSLSSSYLSSLYDLSVTSLPCNHPLKLLLPSASTLSFSTYPFQSLSSPDPCNPSSQVSDWTLPFLYSPMIARNQRPATHPTANHTLTVAVK